MAIHSSLEHTTKPKTINEADAQGNEVRPFAAHNNHVPDNEAHESGRLTDVDVNQKLLQLLERSAQSLRHAAESVENRGLKLLLKVIAQERVYMLNTLRNAVGQQAHDPLDPSATPSSASLQEGLQDIQSSMTVKQEGRENVALRHLLEDEEKLLKAYSAALNHSSGNAPTALLEAQRADIERFKQRLHGVQDGIEPIVARVFDVRVEGERAAMRLQNDGLQTSQIDVVPINYASQPVLHSTAAHHSIKNSPQNTIVAGAVGGALVGGIVGFALAAFIWLAPQLIGWITVGPWTMLFGSAAFGAVFGAVFGFFIGQNQRELDQAVTADGLVNGEILVVAYPQTHQIPLAEEILQLHHARELNR